MREATAAHGATHATNPYQRALAVFDYLGDWFAAPDFRGCAFINTFGEMGGISPDVADIARGHKQALRDYFAEQTTALNAPPALADQLALLANGAMAVAGIQGTSEPAAQAKDAARVLLDAHVDEGLGGCRGTRKGPPGGCRTGPSRVTRCVSRRPAGSRADAGTPGRSTPGSW
ncbi:hypothetical protein [Streptomyces roseoviridis]|uniref:TetR family transcriptional regulator n=1 Tax=Streptomyces roseoviridis TaxID=67361 RepID=A0ABV5QGP0_9ACTN